MHGQCDARPTVTFPAYADTKCRKGIWPKLPACTSKSPILVGTSERWTRESAMLYSDSWSSRRAIVQVRDCNLADCSVTPTAVLDLQIWGSAPLLLFSVTFSSLVMHLSGCHCKYNSVNFNALCCILNGDNDVTTDWEFVTSMFKVRKNSRILLNF